MLLLLPVIVGGLRSRGSRILQRRSPAVASDSKRLNFDHHFTKKLPVLFSADRKPSSNWEGHVSNHSTRDLLTEQHSVGNFTDDETAGLNQSILGVKSPMCSRNNTIFDFGFYDGADSNVSLHGGFCVIGIEADPYLVKRAVDGFSGFLYTGQLQLANVAVSPSGNTSAWTQFYINKCMREWNSFYYTTACRSCTPPHLLSQDACTAVPVKSMTCLNLLRQFGAAEYLKLDIEGAESGCFAALASPNATAFLPKYLSAEITQLNYLDALYQIGYRSFKLVRQDLLHSGTSSRSGPWGNHALDCRSGTAWRTHAEAHHEFQSILAKPFDQHDPCPGGICGIHDAGCKDGAYIWYDVHVTWGPT